MGDDVMCNSRHESIQPRKEYRLLKPVLIMSYKAQKRELCFKKE